MRRKLQQKQKLKAKADEAKSAIDNATTNAAVDQAQSTGTIEVNLINPVAVAKTEAKKEIDDALKAKNDEIDARTDLTDEEKTAAKAEAKTKADAAKQPSIMPQPTQQSTKLSQLVLKK